jgi:group II intron reverse transcriptase/maturase
VASDADKRWLLNAQRKLHQRSWEQDGYVFCKLWGLVTDPRNLRIAVGRVSSNKGARTAGVDGITVRKVIANGVEQFVEELRSELRSGTFRPRPVRRVLIPKAGQPGKFRALGIPTVKDRVVQAAVKNILEPVFEADFLPASHGFRPGRSVHTALLQLSKLLNPMKDKAGPTARLPYQIAIEGDVKACFDNIDHYALMERIRRRIGDAKVNRLVVAFLKAGILSEEQFFRSDAGTPQGGILSPLLANIALSAIEERYVRHVWPRHTPTRLTDAAKIQKRADHNREIDRVRGVVIYTLVRYADDFIILVGAPQGPERHERALALALDEKAELARYLKEKLGLVLSEEKTLVTPVTKGLRFLGHLVGVRRTRPINRWHCAVVIPRDRSQRLRERVKAIFHRRLCLMSLASRLKLLNPMLRGWANFYRHAHRAGDVFSSLDHYVWWTIYRWLGKKHCQLPKRKLAAMYMRRRKPRHSSWDWTDGTITQFRMGAVPRDSLRWAHARPPIFAQTYGEPGA